MRRAGVLPRMQSGDRALTPYSESDLDWLRANYSILGARRCAEHLGRSRQAIYVTANRLGLHTKADVQARKPLLDGADLEEAIRMREQGAGFREIGERFGVCESAATNAILIALCPRRGFRPAERDAHGALVPAEIERLRLMLRKGLKGVDIQLRMGISAATVAEQRRRYQSDLKARDKAPLPPPGNGERYSGARVAKADRKRVEELLLQGYGGPRASAMTGVSKTVCIRIRAALVKRLARKGECLPGCDITGRRLVQKEGMRQITPEQVAVFRRLVLDGIPVRRSGSIAGIGHCSAYRLRDQLNEERAAAGLAPVARVYINSADQRRAARAAAWLKNQSDLYRFRQLIREHGYDGAVSAMTEEIRAREQDEQERRIAERNRPLSFEQQLARVRAGAKITVRQPIRRADPEYTLGGVATGAL